MPAPTSSSLSHLQIPHARYPAERDLRLGIIRASFAAPPVWVSFVHDNNLLLVPILHVPPQSLASDTDSNSGTEALFDAAERAGEGLLAGSNLDLATGFQARDGTVVRASAASRLVESSSFLTHT
jgi:hypothetical protein